MSYSCSTLLLASLSKNESTKYCLHKRRSREGVWALRVIWVNITPCSNLVSAQWRLNCNSFAFNNHNLPLTPAGLIFAPKYLMNGLDFHIFCHSSPPPPKCYKSAFYEWINPICQLLKTCFQAIISRSFSLVTLVLPTINKPVNRAKNISAFLPQENSLFWEKELLKQTATCPRHSALPLKTSLPSQPRPIFWFTPSLLSVMN